MKRKIIFANIITLILIACSTFQLHAQEEQYSTREIHLSDSITIRVNQITHDEYETQKKASVPLHNQPYEIITDFDKMAKMLDGKLKIALDEYGRVYEIIFNDGDTIQIDAEGDYKAYYPQLGILIFEGGHTTDIVFDLNSRDFMQGNPSYYATSPDTKLRINGEDDGQETLMRFLEQWNPTEKRYEFVNWLFGEEHIYDYENRYIYQCCWTSNTTAIYENFGGEKTYYQIEFIVK